MLGATGYTGRLVAAELARCGVRHRLGGRSSDRLAALGPSPHRELHRVEVRDRGELRPFLAGLDLVINTVGPFSATGHVVIEEAVEAGVAYVDCSGEHDFMRTVLARHADAPVPIVVACGFQAVPGDLGAAVVAADVGGDVDELHVHYSARMLPSRGTARTLLGELDGAARPTVRGDGLDMPLAERVLLTHEHPDARVVATVGVPWASAASRVLPLALRVGGRAARRAVEHLPEGPPVALRRRDRATVVVRARCGARSAGFVADLRDTYGLTARFLVEAAGRLRGRGAMPPAQALDAEPFLDAVSGEGPTGSFSWRRAPGDVR